MFQVSRHGTALLGMLFLTVGLTGCSTLYRRAVPASCVSPALPDSPRSSKEPINFVRLRQQPPPVYLIGPRDVLGIYIEGVLGKRDEAAPVHFPGPGEENLPPSIGYPIPVREDGTISLPLVVPIYVGGLTMAQVEEELRVAYMVRQKILRPGEHRMLVTLMKPRTYSVLVVREDRSEIGGLRSAEVTQGSLGAPTLGTTKFGATHLVELPAYQNDVLHALSKGGGLPGLDAVNEVLILRGGPNRMGQGGRIPSDPNAWNVPVENNPNVTRIPLRLGPNDPPLQITEEDIILNMGDVVYIKSRQAELFYTGGMLKGGQHPIPRDYDLDVLGAIGMAGGAADSQQGLGSFYPPTRVIVARIIDGQQVPIRLNLKKALLDPSERILIQPNDYILLQYTEMELMVNMLLRSLRLSYSLNTIGG